MGIFDERIQKKNRLEDEMFVEAFQKLAGVVAGQKAENTLESERLRMLSVMEELGKSLHISIPYTSNPEPTVEWYQEHYFRPQGIMWRFLIGIAPDGKIALSGEIDDWVVEVEGDISAPSAK